ncbi:MULTISPECIES: muconolactone Delta-isomerase [unclassified Novosphingobium]|jgi:muconolactone D-isomerase|uniref:muconolactone Delta-isomerase n=1 Tax=unclassified Novosphingobium TaxID=2644732 RepID=UPI00061CCA2B|nr:MULTISPECIES: muconolactone Delta-isomerase [unclassified Novosphingobium]ODU70608.1 MAG: muconolactone delta-isomerase [Novosphingobium sp. SCN 66-18]MBF5092859.1 muconolactone Delta-isomerase [Novosphingobium sp. NBM11]QCI95850.1 muconolactone Delta-isomerase [Novosphingobium sp. EMRT-2]RQW44750.1 muconolactone Delta-isomerase [Novosphingobium sp. LASN5T]GAO53177.1 muconolactone isomerase [Novosphingobium sp. MD-1]
MLFQVEMLVKVPAHLDPAEFDRLKAEEKARAEDLQRAGTWRHLWRHVGAYANTSIFDVASNEELHAILTGLPLFPFMDITVTALCRHPSSIHSDDR